MIILTRYDGKLTSEGHGQGYVYAQVRFLPTIKRSFTISSSDFSGYTRTFTKDTTLSDDGRGRARQGMCELAFTDPLSVSTPIV